MRIDGRTTIGCRGSSIGLLPSRDPMTETKWLMKLARPAKAALMPGARARTCRQSQGAGTLGALRRRATRAADSGLASLVALLLVASPGQAQPTWREIGKTSTGNPVFVDPGSVKVAEGIVSATIRVTYTKPATTPKGKLTSARSRAMFDCARRTVASRENVLYIDEKRDAVFQRTTIAKPGFGPALDGSFAAVALAHLCTK